MLYTKLLSNQQKGNKIWKQKKRWKEEKEGSQFYTAQVFIF